MLRVRAANHKAQGGEPRATLLLFTRRTAAYFAPPVKTLNMCSLQIPFKKCYKIAHFELDETARGSYNTCVLGTRRKTGSWVQKGPFHRVVGLPLVFGSGGDFFQALSLI